MSIRDERCVEVEESIADVLEGLASTKLMEHIAECDLCRDFKYEAEQAALTMESVGADFHPTAGFPDRLVGLVLEQRPDGPQPALSQSSIVARNSAVGDVREPMRTSVDQRSVDPSSVDPMVTAKTEFAPLADAASKTMLSDAPDLDSQDVNATIIEAPRFAAVDPSASRPGPTRLPDPPPPTQVDDSARLAKAPATISDPFVPTHKTLPLSAVMRDASGSIVPATAPSASATHDSSVPAIVEATTGRNNTGPRGAQHNTDAPIARSSTGAGALPASRLEPAMKTFPERRSPVAAGAAAPASVQGGNVRSLFRRKGFIAALAGGMAAAAAIGAFLVNKSDKTENQVATLEGAWGGTVASVSRASADGGSGFEVCKDTCKPALAGAAVEAGSTLKTDSKTRARVKLADDTWIALDRDTEVSLPAGKTRQAKIQKGMVVADVKKVDGIEPAKLILPHGEVVLSGTKMAATVTDRRASVEIVRGDAEITSKSGVTSKLRAGEEATISGDGEPVIFAKTTMSDVLEWSSESADDVDAPALKGLGELRARKPGKTDEKVGAVKLTKHDVKVRVVDVIARTEVDETFTNQTDEELEGIFRFPLPPGAQIENLALEVDGKMIDGAFVDRDKGAAIWRGVIQNAAPKSPKPREEIIWVAGPWRDPALLEWQRGGRFELRIFPIPKKGSRRVKLTYTEPVSQSGGVRRFTYPLAHDASGSTKIDDFNIDLQVLGNDKEFGVETRGYQLAKADSASGGERFTLAEKNFVPAGDLTVEYALPDRTSALSWWAYDMPASATTVAQTGNAPPAIANNGVNLAGAPKNAQQKAKDAAAEAKALVDDNSPYVALAVRPKLPRFPEGKDRLHIVVVDSSRSMIGERFARATRLASGIVREMDRRDQFMVLACDITCQAMGATDGRTLPLPAEPSAEAAGQVESFLGSIEPDGGSNMLAAVKAARAAAGSSGRELRVIYLGDGTPTVGPTKASTLESAVRHELPSGQGSIIAVALGADADAVSLSAMARGGNGVLVPYVPGQRVNAASVDVLAAAYGSILSDVEVVLPAGLTEVTPKRLDPIPAGGEAFILARMTGGKQVTGDVVLRGKIGNERFEKKWEAKVVSSSKAGNAFVPRLFAAAKIAELEQKGASDDRERVVALSKQFNVASRHTSLIVLESEAMFKAFGLDKNGIATAFTGEERADRSSAAADELSADDAESERQSAEEKSSSDKSKKESPGHSARDFGFDGDAKGGGGFAAPPPSPTAAGKAAAGPAPAAEAAAPAPKSPAKPQPSMRPNDPFSPDWQQDPARRPAPISRPQNLVPMRRVFDRKASFSADNQLVSEVANLLVDAESASKAAPDSRDKTVALYKALMSSGRVGEALELTAKWSQRDALDPEALMARADLAAMNGDREKSMRIMSGLADVRPGDKTVQKRLAAAFTQLGAADHACQHRLALADIDDTDVNAVAAAVRCSQDQGLRDVSQTILTSVRSDLREKIDAASRTLKLNETPALLGDVRVTATWTTPVDLDLAIVDKSGKRVSFLGSNAQSVSVSAKDASSSSSETLAISGLGSGTFAVEIVRANKDNSNTPVRGELLLTLPGGEVRKVPFTLTGARQSVGSMKVFFTSRLVPANDPSFGGGGWRGRPVF